jgi:hypothetical protein
MKLGTGRSIARKDDSGNVLAFTPGRASPRVPLATTTYLEEEIEAAGVLHDAKERKGKPRP